jgi:single-strand DNA-binding protein
MSRSINKAIIVGNLTRDPEMRYTPSGQAVANFGVATNRRWTTNGEQREETEFHNVVSWGKLAEICSQLLKKGRKVYIEGRLRTRQWEGKDGVTRRRTEIVARDMVVLDKPGQFSSEGVPEEPVVEEPRVEELEKSSEEKDSGGKKKGKSKKGNPSPEDVDPEVIPF